MKWGYDMLKNGAIALLPGSVRIMLGLADSNDPSHVSLQDALWRRPIALFATATLRRTLGQVTLRKEVERVFGRCAPYDPPRSSNKQKEQAPFACSPHFERVFGRWAPCDPSSLRSQAFKRGTRLSLHLRSERVTRIELASTAWEAVVLPMNYTRVGI